LKLAVIDTAPEDKPLTSFSARCCFVQFAAITAIAAYLFDKLATQDPEVTNLLSPIAVFTAIIFSLLAGSVGMAASILGFFHGGFFNESSRFGSMAANYISLALTFLAAGFSIRCLRSKFATGSKGNGAALKSLFALDICLMLFSLLYALHTGMFRHDGVRREHHVARDAAVVGGTGAAAHHAGKTHHHDRDVESAGYAPSSTATGHSTAMTSGAATPGYNNGTGAVNHGVHQTNTYPSTTGAHALRA
jgi:uncharacterized membrane protein